MTIHIEALTFDVIIGLLESERHTPQSVIVDLHASYSYQNDQFLDYAQMVQDIQETLHKEQYYLLEEALLGLKHLLHFKYPAIQTLSIKLSKPNIIPQCSVALSHQWEFQKIK